MRYKNTKTRAIIDSPFKINGDNWEEVNQQASTEVDIPEDDENQKKEYVEEEIDLEAMTNAQLEDFAKQHNIELTTEDKKNKPARIAAIVKAFE